MTIWLSEHTASDDAHTAIHRERGTDRWLRRIDVLLAVMALAVLAVPYALARRIGSLHREEVLGHAGRAFRRLRRQLPDTPAGRALARLGAEDWPVLFNILRGDMAWVGPPPQSLQTPASVPPLSVPAGVICLWDIRRRTAVDFGGAQQAEREYLARRGVAHDLGVLVRAAFVSIFSPPSTACPGRVRICDVEFDNVDMAQALERIEVMLDGAGANQVSFVNPACVNIAARQRGYRRCLARAALVLPDGIGTKIAADILGTPLRQNVNGTDLFPRLCERLDAREARLFLLGGQPGVPQRVASEIAARWPGIRIVGLRDGFFDTSEEGGVVAQVRAARPDVLLVARGVPTQDIFIDRYLHHLGAKVSLGVGGLFDFVSGRISRAPQWMRESGLEWIYRLAQEPRRMWERYLVGNFTFLARVLLQRLWLRRAQSDSGPAQEADPAGESEHVAVLFATACAAEDIPVSRDCPACLLPYGPTTFVERCIAQLAQAGIRRIHLVASMRPDLLRQALGDGEMWGVRLTWHLVKDDSEAPGVLRQLRLGPRQRVLVGQAHRVLCAAALDKLLATDLKACSLDDQGQRRWSGWMSMPARALRALNERAAGETFESAVRRSAGPWLLLQPGESDTADSAAGLLAAQAAALRADLSDSLADPAIRMPWGSMSPRASVSPSARITGPAWIGPGCIVGPRAELGPDSVLTRDVIVSADSRLADALVLPETIVGKRLDLRGVIANGCSVQHVALCGRLELRESDGVLSRLHSAGTLTRPGRLAGRALAVALLPLVAPVLGAVAAGRRSRGLCALPWTRVSAVGSQDPVSGALGFVKVRVARPGLDRVAALAAVAGALMDIAEGSRCWMGPRPRMAAEWNGLSRDWQSLLALLPIGWLHMEAWSDTVDFEAQARAAADLMWVDPPRGLKRLEFFAKALPAAIQPASH